MALRLPKFQAGRPILEELTAEKLNQLVDAIRQCEINSGVGYDVTRGPGGTSLAIRRERGSSTSQIGAAYVVGPTNTGVNYNGDLIEPGESSFGWSVKTPNETEFYPISVFGENNYYYYKYPVSCSSADFIYERESSGITITESDVSRYSGKVSSYQENVYDYSYPDCPQPNDLYFDTCAGTTYSIGNYADQETSYSAKGAFGRILDSCENGISEQGNYIFKKIFNLGIINPAIIKLRFRVRAKSSASIISTVLLNSAAVNYEPSGPFTSSWTTREISSGFVSGENFLEFIVNHSDENFNPGIECQFEPTTALIVSKTGDGVDEIGGFSDLTEAQQDLIGLGTPVKALNGNDPYIWSYKGTGSKTSSGSYNELRPA